MNKLLGQKGFTLIELLVVVAIIGILLSIAIPNLLKARISANEANARKAMQTLRDAEGEYFEQDLDGNGTKDYTESIGTLGYSPSLRDPEGNGKEEDALLDNTFPGAHEGPQVPGNSVGGCPKPKAGYCIAWDANTNVALGGPLGEPNYQDFGWMTSMTSFGKNGRKAFAVSENGFIKCSVVKGVSTGSPGKYDAGRQGGSCN